jgi:hypothetical protein
VALTFTVDTVAPTQTVTLTSYSIDTTPVLSGTLSAALTGSELLHVFRDGADVGTVTMVTGPNWTFVDSGVTEGQAYTYYAMVVDEAGNTSTPSNSCTFIIDTTPPSTMWTMINTVIDDVDPQTGSVAFNGYTNDTTPTLQGIISAELTGSYQVHVFRSDNDGASADIGTATVTGTNWTFQDSNLTDGWNYTYYAMVVDGAGYSGRTLNSYTINIDTTAPTQGVTINNYLDNTGYVTGLMSSGTTTDEQNPILNGTISAPLAQGGVVGQPSAEAVHLTRTNDITGTVTDLGTVTVTGLDWSYKDGELTWQTTYTYTAWIEDQAGNTNPNTNFGSLTLTTNFGTDDVRSFINSIIDAVEPNTGDIASQLGGYTNDPNPTLNGSVSVLNDGDYIVIYRQDNDGAPQVVSDHVTITPAGTSSGTWTFQDHDLQDGSTYTYMAELVSAISNTIDSAPYVIHVLTTPPLETVTITGFDDFIGSLTGLNFPSNTTTDEQNPILHGSYTGTLLAGEVIAVYRDNAFIGTVAESDIDRASHTWTFTDNGNLTDGAYAYTAQVENGATYPGTPSDTFTINVETPLPALPMVTITGYTDNVTPQTGDFDFTVPTNDLHPTLNGTITAPLADGESLHVYRLDSNPTSLVTEAFSLTQAPQAMDSGNTMPPGADLGTATVDNDRLTWTFQDLSDSGTLSDGETYTYSARVVDAAGNLGPLSEHPQALTIDTTAPDTPATPESYNDNFGGTVIAQSTAPTTSDLTPGINVGTGFTDKPTLYVDGNKVAATYDATAGTLTPNDALGAGEHSFTYTLTDAAGNESAQSGALTITTIETPPLTPIITIDTYTDDVGSMTGTFDFTVWTDDRQPLLNGRVENLNTGDVVRVYDGTAYLGEATVDAAINTWSFQVTTDLAYETHLIRAVIVDATGNEGNSATTGLTVVIPPGPLPYVSIDSYTDDYGSMTGTFDFTVWTDDRQPLLNGHVGNLNTGDVVHIFDGTAYLGEATVDAAANTWSFQVTTDLAAGIHDLKAVIVNPAGGEGRSDTATLIVDVPPPPTTTISIDTYTDDQGANTGDFQFTVPTDDRQPAINGTVINPDPTFYNSPFYIRIYLDGRTTYLGETTADSTGHWTFQVTSDLGEGPHTFVAVVVDAAGIEGNSATATLTIDVTALTGPTQHVTIDSYTDAQPPQTGDFPFTTPTNDQHPLINGSIDAPLTDGETVHIYRVDNNPPPVTSPVVSLTSLTLAPQAADSNPSPGSLDLGAATMTDATHWTFQDSSDSSLSDGHTYVYTARVVDAAGNVGPLSDLPQSLTVDTTAPDTPATPVSYNDDFGGTVIAQSMAPTTSDLTPGINVGTGFTDKPTLYVDGNKVDSTYDATAGTLTPNASLSTGEHNFTYTLTDAAGNESDHSGTLAITIVPPTTPPPVTMASAPLMDAALPTTSDAAPTNGSLLESSGANDTFNLVDGAHNTLLYKLLAANDATGGNGVDQVNGFTVGDWQTTKADRIDISQLLTGYHPVNGADGPAHFVDGVAKIDAGDTIGNYLSVSHGPTDNNTVINIDMTGAGHYSPLITLVNVNVTLETLLANHQIVV